MPVSGRSLGMRVPAGLFAMDRVRLLAMPRPIMIDNVYHYGRGNTNAIQFSSSSVVGSRAMADRSISVRVRAAASSRLASIGRRRPTV